MIRYRYNQQLQPPAPFLVITLRNPTTGSEARDVPAQIDTAADRTVLPAALVQALDLPQMGILQVGGLGGVVHTLPTYAVLLGVHDLPPQAFKVIGSPGEEWVLLGRDVDNTLRLLLDGPQAALELH